jgi:hypothetical protein
MWTSVSPWTAADAAVNACGRDDGSDVGGEESGVGGGNGNSNHRNGLGRLAAALHFPSNELIALTDRGNVLAVSPPLEPCPLGRLDRRGGDEAGVDGERRGDDVDVTGDDEVGTASDVYGDAIGGGGSGGGGGGGGGEYLEQGLSPPCIRHVGRLRGFADDFGPSRQWHLGSLAVGPCVRCLLWST